jgi:tetratricopeptide (TPR) repeat protein
MRSLSKTATVLVVAFLLVAVLAGQALTDRVAPTEANAETGRLMGRASFAYLSGLRTFTAAVLWNRIRPQFHDYYDGSLDKSAFMIPTMRIVTWLDPEFVDAYSSAAWVVWRVGELDKALEFAGEGVEINPEAGELRSVYAQLLQFDGDLDEAAVQAEAALGEDVIWRDLDEQHNGYVVIRSVFLEADQVALYEEVDRRLVELDALFDDERLGEIHDEHGHEHDD